MRLWAEFVVQELGTLSPQLFFLRYPNQIFLFMILGFTGHVMSHGEMTLLLKHGICLYSFLLVPNQLFLRSNFTVQVHAGHQLNHPPASVQCWDYTPQCLLSQESFLFHSPAGLGPACKSESFFLEC